MKDYMSTNPLIPANFGILTSLVELAKFKSEVERSTNELDLYVKNYIDSIVLTKDQVLDSIPELQHQLYCKEIVTLGYNKDRLRIEGELMTSIGSSINIKAFSGTLSDILTPNYHCPGDMYDPPHVVKYFIIDSNNHRIIPVMSKYYHFEDNNQTIVIDDSRCEPQDYSRGLYYHTRYYHKFNLLSNEYLGTYPSNNKVLYRNGVHYREYKSE